MRGNFSILNLPHKVLINEARHTYKHRRDISLRRATLNALARKFRYINDRALDLQMEIDFNTYSQDNLPTVSDFYMRCGILSFKLSRSQFRTYEPTPKVTAN